MKKQVVGCLLSGVMILTIFNGCTDKAARTDGKQGSKPMEISVSVFDRGTVPGAEGNYESNRWTKWINEQSGVKVNWVPIPRNDARRKFNMLIAAAEAPDLIVDYDSTLVPALIGQGAIQPIDDYVNKYSKAYKKYLQEHPELNQFVTYNGKMYAATSKRSQDAIINHGIWIRQDWLDKLNLKMPDTDEELINVARAFRDRDPDGNGIKDTTAFAIANWHEIFPSMYQASNLWYNEGGTLKFGQTLDRYGDAMAYLKTLYDEELIDREFITDKDWQHQKELWVRGKSGIFTYNWSEAACQNKELLQNNPDAKPVPLKPVATKYGRNGLLQEAAPYLYIAFNRDMKNPEAGIKFLDWMIEKGWFNIKFGMENEHYRMVDGVPQNLNLEKSNKEVAYAYEYAMVTQWDIKPEWIPVMAAQDPLSQQLAQQRVLSLKVNSEVTFRRDIPVDPQLAQVTKLLTEFQPLRDDIRMKVVVGGSQQTPQLGMELIRKEWNRLGGEEAEKLMNEWYQKNKK